MIIGSVCQWVHRYLKGLLAGFMFRLQNLAKSVNFQWDCSIRRGFQVFVSIQMKDGPLEIGSKLFVLIKPHQRDNLPKLFCYFFFLAFKTSSLCQYCYIKNYILVQLKKYIKRNVSITGQLI